MAKDHCSIISNERGYMAKDIFQEMDDKVKGIEDAVIHDKDKVNKLAREYGLDPQNVEHWPEEVKEKLKNT